jgi:ABC-2 type transport system permease protein
MNAATGETSAIAKVGFKSAPSTNQAIFLTTIRRVLRGAVLVALFAVVMMAVQGFAMAKTYPDVHAREEFASTLAAAPGLGVLYGEPLHIETTAGYMLYRVMPIAALVAAFWGLSAMTKLMRGQEEDGRWELLLSGQTTGWQAALSTLGGGLAGVAIGFAIAGAGIVTIGGSSDISLSPGRSLLAALAVMLPAAICMSIGAITSQLYGTRRRAFRYGIVVILVFAALRAIGNVIADLDWLKYLTPFGWIDKLHIVAGTQGWLILALLALAAVAGTTGIYLAGKRDLNQSLITENDTTKPNLRLLGQPWQFTLRMMRSSLLGWLGGSLVLFGIIAAVSKFAVQAAQESSELTKVLASLSGTNQLALSFLSLGTFFVAITLMTMLTAGVGAVRSDEARGYVDNILVGPVSRIRWLSGRWIVLGLAAAVICLVTTSSGWLIARVSGIEVGAGSMIGGSLSLMGPLMFLLGIGALLYGAWPRLSVMIMSAYITWSFGVQLVASAVDVNQWIAKSSLFYYIPLVPATSPDWKTFGVLLLLGIGLCVAGTALFNRRDIVSE